jgi:hypothetical protein
VRAPDFTLLTSALAIGGRFGDDQVEGLACGHGFRAVVDLREETCDDAMLLARHGITFLHLPTKDHAAVSQENLERGVAFANRHLDLDERVLVHCEHGIGRSVTLALCILVSRGTAPLDALDAAKSRRPLVSPSPAQYGAWAAWLDGFRCARPVSWHLPDFDAFKAIAYRHLAVARP